MRGARAWQRSRVLPGAEPKRAGKLDALRHDPLQSVAQQHRYFIAVERAVARLEVRDQNIEGEFCSTWSTVIMQAVMREGVKI